MTTAMAAAVSRTVQVETVRPRRTLEVVAVLGMCWRPGTVLSGRSLRGLRFLDGGA